MHSFTCATLASIPRQLSSLSFVFPARHESELNAMLLVTSPASDSFRLGFNVRLILKTLRTLERDRSTWSNP